MPKMRDPVDSFRDIQRHLSVGKSRVIKLETHRDRDWIITKIDEMALTIGTIISKLPEDDNSSSNKPNKSISTELERIKKELEKDIPKIDYHMAVPAMCNCTDMKQVYIIGKKYNMPPEEIDQVIRDAPANTNLAKAHAALKAKHKPAIAAVQPVITPGFDIEQEQDNTNDSEDYELDEKMKAMLAGE